MNIEEIKKLALLARIDMPESELAEMAHDFDSILSYVSQVQEVADAETVESNHFLTNVMREDIATNATGQYTEKILEEMPETEGIFLKVKQIL